MNPPTLITRFLGTPLVAAALYVGCAMAVLGWFGGEVPWWWALFAVCFVGTVRKSAQNVRRYNQWYGGWQAMGNAQGVTAPRRKRSSWLNVACAVILFIVIPMFMAAPGPDKALSNALTWVWLAVAGYLLWKLAAGIRHVCFGQRVRTVAASASKPSLSPDVVTWMLPRASSSASRAEAMRNVPDYCARLLAAH